MSDQLRPLQFKPITWGLNHNRGTVQSYINLILISARYMPESNNKQPQTTNMLSFAQTPIFTGSWDHRPSVSSPLSSSPIRASSPLSPVDSNSLPQRQVQSSPIQPPKFKFASRPSKPNPVVRKREDAQESRRRSFLQNVRQKSDEKAWQRRDIEGQVRHYFLQHPVPSFFCERALTCGKSVP